VGQGFSPADSSPEGLPGVRVHRFVDRPAAGDALREVFAVDHPSDASPG